MKSGLWNKYKINYLQRAKKYYLQKPRRELQYKEATNSAPTSEQFYTTPFGSVWLSPSMQTKLNWHHVSKTASFIQGGPTSRLKVSHKHGFWIRIWLHIYISQGPFVIIRHSNYRKLNCHTAGCVRRIVGECWDLCLVVWLMKHKWTVMQARSGWETLSEGQRGAQGLWRSCVSQGGAQLQRPAVFVLWPALQQEKGQHADGYR